MIFGTIFMILHRIIEIQLYSIIIRFLKWMLYPLRRLNRPLPHSMLLLSLRQRIRLLLIPLFITITILQPLRKNLAFLLSIMIYHNPRATFLMSRWLLPSSMRIKYKILHLLESFYRLRLIELLQCHLRAYFGMSHLLQNPNNTFTHLSLRWWQKWNAILKMRTNP